eukprot:gnl/Chilomastix_caulleri/6523.p1 GENE.gnl/Chilomastix_caulleri/6523~~gnl/Chilomastix_caulleri/6523.p1  ORF type:complete len:68 (+),score=11.82 gnl/Chilomastix_caulleri/6523:103-306(+)
MVNTGMNNGTKSVDYCYECQKGGTCKYFGNILYALETSIKDCGIDCIQNIKRRYEGKAGSDSLWHSL